MQFTIHDRLEMIFKSLEAIQEDLLTVENAKKQALIDLIEACEAIDAHYKEFCDWNDEEDGIKFGTTYEEGMNVEYQIEASWWHDVSLALRKLRSLSIDGDATVS